MQIQISPVVLICDGFCCRLAGERGPHPPELGRFPPSTLEELEMKNDVPGRSIIVISHDTKSRDIHREADGGAGRHSVNFWR
jgi:hypothetical protein